MSPLDGLGDRYRTLLSLAVSRLGPDARGTVGRMIGADSDALALALERVVRSDLGSTSVRRWIGDARARLVRPSKEPRLTVALVELREARGGERPRLDPPRLTDWMVVATYDETRSWLEQLGLFEMADLAGALGADAMARLRLRLGPEQIRALADRGTESVAPPNAERVAARLSRASDGSSVLVCAGIHRLARVGRTEIEPQRLAHWPKAWLKWLEAWLEPGRRPPLADEAQAHLRYRLR